MFVCVRVHVCVCVLVRTDEYTFTTFIGILAYAEPALTDDGRMKDSVDDTDSLVDSRDVKGTLTVFEAQTEYHKISTTAPLLLLCALNEDHFKLLAIIITEQKICPDIIWLSVFQEEGCINRKVRASYFSTGLLDVLTLLHCPLFRHACKVESKYVVVYCSLFCAQLGFIAVTQTWEEWSLHIVCSSAG